jgi:Ca2+-binding RTX toxin-like protein
MATIYVSPLGGGNASGSSVSNALPVTSLDHAIQLAGAGGTVVMLADKGAYNLTGSVTLTHGGTDGAPVTIMGADSAGHAMDIIINGTRDATWTAGEANGNEIFRLYSGANNLVFENMGFNNVGMAFRLGADLHNVTIENMTADNVRYFTGTYAGGTSTTANVTGLTVKDVDVHGFSKSVVMLKGDCSNILLDNVHGDGEYQDGDNFEMGVALQGTVHDVIIQNCSMDNSIAAASTGAYTNGDGFASEVGVYNVQFINCSASGNGDGGFDLKSSNTTLTNCYSEDNKRNYRIWGSDVTLKDCVGVDPHKHIVDATGGQCNIWVGANAHNVQVVGGSFVDSGSSTTVVRSDGGDINFSGTSIWHASTGDLQSGANITGIDSSLVHSVTPTGTYSTDGEQYLSDTPPPPPPPSPPPPPPPAPEPATLELSSATVTENAAGGTCVGYVSLVNGTGTTTYSLANDCNGCFAVDPNTGEIMVVNGGGLDYETASTANIVVVASNGSGTASQSFDISILDENDAPDGLSVTGGTVAENAAAGTLVATVIGHDPDAGDTASYSLSDNSSGRFTIDPHTGAIVVAAGAVLDYEQQHNYDVTVVVTDSQGLTYSEILSIGIKDVAESIVRQAINGSNRDDVIARDGGNYSVNALRGNDQITTGSGADIIVGGGGDDTISVGAGDDSIRFSGSSDGYDWIDGGSGYDVVEAMGRSTIIGLHSLSGVEEIRANGYSSVSIAGSYVADTLDFSNVVLTGITSISGAGGNDTLIGNGAGNVIFGDAGADRLTGGGGADVFSYRYTTDSTLAARDTIADFTAGVDKLDLHLIDAMATKAARGDQAFTFIGESAFTGVAGQLRVDSSNANVTHIYGDVNGDGVADFVIDLFGSVQLQSSDFIL